MLFRNFFAVFFFEINLEFRVNGQFNFFPYLPTDPSRHQTNNLFVVALLKLFILAFTSMSMQANIAYLHFAVVPSGTLRCNSHHSYLHHIYELYSKLNLLEKDPHIDIHNLQNNLK